MAEVNDNSSIQLFEDQKIRTAWDAEKEEWYFSDRKSTRLNSSHAT